MHGLSGRKSLRGTPLCQQGNKAPVPHSGHIYRCALDEPCSPALAVCYLLFVRHCPRASFRFDKRGHRRFSGLGFGEAGTGPITVPREHPVGYRGPLFVSILTDWSGALFRRGARSWMYEIAWEPSFEPSSA